VFTVSFWFQSLSILILADKTDIMELKIYVAGNFVDTDNLLDVINPYTGSIAGTTWLAGKEEYEQAVSAAAAVRKQLAGWPSWKRYESLMFIRNRLLGQRSEFARIITAESGKPMRYALGEVDRSVQTFTIAAEESKRLPSEYMSLDWTSAGEGREGIVRWFPAGIVGGIAPFNFPLNLAVHKLAPAIAAGCPIILKPSSNTPLTALKLASILAESGLPTGAVSILPMNRTTGNMLVTDPRLALLSFTGTPDVGWKMKVKTKKKKVVLELGGNAGVIVSRSAETETALRRCLTGAFSYSGQVCIHTQRIFVHQSIFSEFSERLAGMASKLLTGDPALPETEFSSMIDEDNAKRVEQWVDEALTMGARLLYGGKREGTFYSPTILTSTGNSMRVCSDEVFGPVVTIDPFNDFEEALDLINSTRFGLQAGVFTNDIREMDRAFAGLDVGGVVINDVPTFRVDHMPYGGIKDSGLGREGVKYAILDMMEPKILVKGK
jgi:glyceraldehyde-3-phosphate dehydrogenase (NADP+)